MLLCITRIRLRFYLNVNHVSLRSMGGTELWFHQLLIGGLKMNGCLGFRMTWGWVMTEFVFGRTSWMIDFYASFFISDLLSKKTLLLDFAFSELMEIPAVQTNTSLPKESRKSVKTLSKWTINLSSRLTFIIFGWKQCFCRKVFKCWENEKSIQ